MSSKREDEFNDDDYVARLLAEDAKKSSIKYASAGLSALLPNKAPRSGAKPNTRFLNHLVRDVDSHNAALKRKEENETRTRLEAIRKKEREDERQRALELAGSKRRLADEHVGRRRDRESKRARRSASPTRDRRDEKRRHRTHDSGRRGDDRHGHRRRGLDSEEDVDTTRKRSTNDHSSRSEKYRLRRRDPDRDMDSGGKARPASPTPRSLQRESLSRGSDSDPLEDIIGPLPSVSQPAAPPIRGRGAHRPFKSNIDEHFSSTYDPSLDVHLDSESEPEREGEDWHMALEALRDRKMWKQKQIERMKEAGFKDEEIDKWGRGVLNEGKESEQDVKNVRWRKQGEAREWDAGKELLSDNEGLAKTPTTGVLDKGKDGTSKGKKSLEDGWSRKNSGLLRNFRNALG